MIFEYFLKSAFPLKFLSTYQLLYTSVPTVFVYLKKEKSQQNIFFCQIVKFNVFNAMKFVIELYYKLFRESE